MSLSSGYSVPRHLSLAGVVDLFMTQRHRSFGMIDRLSSGRWRARYLHPVTKQRITVMGSPFRTKREADERLSVIEAELRRPEWSRWFAELSA